MITVNHLLLYRVLTGQMPLQVFIRIKPLPANGALEGLLQILKNRLLCICFLLICNASQVGLVVLVEATLVHPPPTGGALHPLCVQGLVLLLV